ncbi:aspartyl-phosphate phosphatase Spo0E family protein [Bacillus kexueae]|uniref:aspartyl-phosphate phosphatase Spo0E family protein n=1 Tax=Aeribacillus kexueae TaxID=2078952 RepID=UPI001FAEA958|nr:aspartyl-phosphate phosphatase Spo0E family protein [Bacillus kexueae]
MVDNHVLEQLDEEISLKRKELVEMARLKGFTSVETITISQELDSLLNDYQKLMVENQTIPYMDNELPKWTVSDSFFLSKSNEKESAIV